MQPSTSAHHLCSPHEYTSPSDASAARDRIPRAAAAANPNADGRFISGWYASGAALIINGLIGDLFVICIFVDGVRPQDVVRRRILAPAAKTQARMNELASIPADIFLSFRIQLLNKFLVLGLMYGFA